MLDRPTLPDIQGIETFRGPLFHTARWDQGFAPRGKRVALIGTGASGLQLAPVISRTVDRLVVFQRTPAWVAPSPTYLSEIDPAEAWLIRNLPFYANWLRLRATFMFGDAMLPLWDIDPEWKDPVSLNAMNGGLHKILVDHLMGKIGHNPELVAKATPKYAPMAKRWVIDSGWYDTLNRENVDLVTDPIAEITPDGVLMKSGELYQVDAIVMATGFRANDFLWPLHLEGRGGKHIRQTWSKDGARAYLGVTIPDFPNFFCLYGPNTNPKAGTPCLYDELQVRYSLMCIQRLILGEAHSIDVTHEAYDRYNREIDEILNRSIWMDQNQKSYYRNEYGRVATNLPWGSIGYWKLLRAPDFGDYKIE
jgi:4-hydroxyacetophenone monooxygenase